MKAIVFDVDDTIYDQQVVFDQACRDVFGEIKRCVVGRFI